MTDEERAGVSKPWELSGMSDEQRRDALMTVIRDARWDIRCCIDEALAAARDEGAAAERARLTALVPEGLVWCLDCRQAWVGAIREVCPDCAGILVQLIAPQEPEKGRQG